MISHGIAARKQSDDGAPAVSGEAAQKRGPETVMES